MWGNNSEGTPVRFKSCFLLPTLKTIGISSLLDNRPYGERMKWSKIYLPNILDTTALIMDDLNGR